LKVSLPSATRIHMSGSLVTKKAWGAHPLMTFGPQLYDLEKYLAIPFVLDEKAPSFRELFPGLHNRYVRLSEKQKAKYHAVCVMSGNFSCLLWQKLFESLEGEFSIPPQIAEMYLRQQMENLLSSYKTALTGPLARGDEATIARNLKALEGDPFKGIYEAFVKAYPHIGQKNREKKAS
jgi:2-dehydropantoate 2-reductase